MASITRSSRRAEGLHSHHGNGTPPMTRSGPGLYHHDGRTKRALDVVEREFESMRPKKTRIAVEILSKPPPILSDNIKMAPPRRKVSAAPAANVVAKQQAQPVPPPPRAPPQQQQTQPEDNLTKHQAKVINGIKHELDRLQPQPADTSKEQGRKLRSQEATRFKSELSAYFPDYDEVIGNDPKEQHLLNLDTPIIVVDSNPRRGPALAPGALPLEPPHSASAGSDCYPLRGYGDALFTDVYDAQRIDFGFLEPQYKNIGSGDPLPDSLFEPIHRRAERLERSIRNTEKGRAQHEKDQIIRLLEGLQGHDWLRVMGVSGVTETKKKTFEPAREHFIKGCQLILDKFRNWSLEEKRRKLEKEKALAEQAEEEEQGEEQEDDGSSSGRPVGEDGNEEAASRDDNSDVSSPAKQLREEALARSRLAARNRRSGAKSRPAPPKPPEPPKEFKSFFSKKYERDGALNRHRRAGRKVLAWGHPIPEIGEMDFELPEDYRDSELLKARARQKRRDRRGHKH
ncbi:something about silencing, SAS, complex subunit 4-domain-containing protein [Stachybotrys elegans]|uniref:Something about silencing, SAS, complex subunit 4-domain-containing protein n=1 Tax=Stachybotrys elegans TaxID=80388 RepID=A0A8K0SRR0_9HYPO|nr:something about silencing, SAS, complex subunit 4-domain-containing protein [Stachybotrys elegans]